MAGSPLSLLDRLAAACFTVLLCAGALYLAVRLVESVASALLVIGVVVVGLLLVAAAVRLLLSRSRW